MQPAMRLHCHQCGLQVDIPSLSHRQRAFCPRCKTNLTGFRRFQTEYSTSSALAGILFLLLSLPYPFLTFISNGQSREIALPSGLQTLIELDFFSLAIITALATLVLPGFTLVGMLTLGICRLTSVRPSWLKRVYRGVIALLPWSMAEIFLVGTLVSLVKVTDLAAIELGVSFIAFCLFVFSFSTCLYFFDRANYLSWLGESSPPHTISLKQRSLSIQRTWALLFTATVLYIPANIFPIMHTTFLGSNEPNTILGGVITLWESGSYPIAMIIFFASVAIPIAKLIVLAWLNWTVQSGRTALQERRTLLHSVTEWVGRWSMVDVFVVAILVALIQLGNTISIYPGNAALAFCAVVFFTMLAAMTFDARLIWQKDLTS